MTVYRAEGSGFKSWWARHTIEFVPSDPRAWLISSICSSFLEQTEIAGVIVLSDIVAREEFESLVATRGRLGILRLLRDIIHNRLSTNTIFVFVFHVFLERKRGYLLLPRDNVNCHCLYILLLV